MRLDYLRRAAATVVADPLEGLDRLRNRLERVEREVATWPYTAEPDWEKRLHELLGAPWPCTPASEFGELWNALPERLDVDALPLGEYHDADPSLARALWCVATHLRPRVVVETGVARGVASSFLLHALDRAGEGRLWSIDLPPLQRTWQEQAGTAVASELRERWTLLRGSSRRHLPGLLRRLGEVDLFVHDSLHTERNMRFEFRLVWPRLRPGGVLVADDVGTNAALGRFLAEVPSAASLVAPASGKPGSLFGVVVKHSS